MGLPLVTRAEYKAYAGLSSTNEDAKIDILNPKISELVKSLCNTTFIDYVNDSKIDYFDGGVNTFIPSEGPLLAVTGLEYSTDYGVTYTELVENTDFVVLLSKGTILPIGVTNFPYYPNGYKLTYNSGYEVLPAALKLAILDLISYYMKNDSAVHSNRAPGGNTVQIEYVINTSLPAHIRRVLDLYADNFN